MPIGVDFASPTSEALQNVDIDDDDKIPRFRKIDNVLNAGPAHIDEEQLHLGVSEEPTTYAEAAQHREWEKAMEDELRSINENLTWSLVNLPPGQKAIGLKWVFKLKKDASGAVVKHKARLVMKGYVRQPGVDFDEVFAPVAQLESVRLLLAIAAHRGWEVHHMDVKSAFLNGDLTEEVYVIQPPGFELRDERHKVYKLHKALYGLR